MEKARIFANFLRLFRAICFVMVAFVFGTIGFAHAEDEIIYPFSLTTTELSAGDIFRFRISSAGTFYVDCGTDGTLSGTGVANDTITKSDTSNNTYTCTYTTGGIKTIRFGGTATGYSTNTTAAISFDMGNYNAADSLNVKKISAISGSLGQIFGTIANPSIGSGQPKFHYAFIDASNMTGTNIDDPNNPGMKYALPPTLFDGIYGAPAEHMFDYTFDGCSGLTGSIPSTLFGNLSGTPAQYMFYRTFGGCSGLTGSIPSTLFSGISGTPAQYMFDGTFSGCSGLTGSIPSTLFDGISGTPADYMFKNTFAGCSGLTGSIPSGLFGNISGTPAREMFSYTFSGCSGLTGSIPSGLFGNLTGNPANGMFYRTFYNCIRLNGFGDKTYVPGDFLADIDTNTSVSYQAQNMFYGTQLASSCPAGTYNVTRDQFNNAGKPWCSPCTDGKTSPTGATDVSQCVRDYPFSLTTTELSTGDIFRFRISSAGTFYVDCGTDGTLSGTGVANDTITKSDTSDNTYTCTYTSGGVKTVRFVGKATGYSSIYPAIRFYISSTGNNDTNVKKISAIFGSLGQIFGTVENPSTGSGQPRFNETFSGASNMTGTNIDDPNNPGMKYALPPTLFNGVSGVPASSMFSSTFSGCIGLTGSIPATLFGNISGAPTEYIFAYTFNNCNKLTGSIPSELFAGVSGAPAEAMFYGTFADCSGLTGSIPAGLFAGVSGAPAKAMFFGTFSGCRNLTGSIPSELFAGVSGAPAKHMFYRTFSTCIRLTEKIPSELFAGISGAPAEAMFLGMFENCSWLNGFGDTTYVPGNFLADIDTDASVTRQTQYMFTNTQLDNPCPAGTYTVTREQFNDAGKPWCTPCPDGTTSPAGATSVDQCGVGYTVTYNCGSGSGNAPTANTSAIGNSSFTPATNTCTPPTNSVFTGWLVSDTEDMVQPGTAFTWEYGSDKTLTAQYVIVDYPFSLTTTELSENDTFQFKISAAGTFYIDCGDGGTLSGTGVTGPDANNIYIITKSDTSDTMYICTYTNGGTKTIQFGGTAIGYNSADTATTPAIKFDTDNNNSNVKKISSISGSLGQIFGTIANPSIGSGQPRFNDTFNGASNMTGTDIPDLNNPGINYALPPTLFDGVSGAPTSFMFDGTFNSCSGLTGSIPAGLFAGISGAPASGMFYRTFIGCRGLTGSIPATLFGNLTGRPANHMFAITFNGCSGLTGSIPAGLFAGISGAPAQSMFDSTFSGCSGLTGSIPAGLFAGISGAPAERMFYDTFRVCSGLTGSIPAGLFSGISGAPARGMFSKTFYGCSGLTGSIPAGLFAGISGAPAGGMFSGTFDGCSGLTRFGDTTYVPENFLANINTNTSVSSQVTYMFRNTQLDNPCPAGTYTVTREQFNDAGKPWCTPCPDGKTSPAGATDVNQCGVGYTVTYNCGSGSGNAPTTNTSAIGNSSFTPATNTCTPPTNSVFTGWLVSDTEDMVQPGTAFTWEYGSDKILTAQYTLLSIITYDCGDGTGDAPATASVAPNEAFVPAVNTCTPPTNGLFTGWLVSGTENIVQPGSEIVWDYNTDKTLTAQYITVGNFPFSITTTEVSAGDAFVFTMGANGDFYVDCGDGGTLVFVNDENSSGGGDSGGGVIKDIEKGKINTRTAGRRMRATPTFTRSASRLSGIRKSSANSPDSSSSTCSSTGTASRTINGRTDNADFGVYACYYETGGEKTIRFGGTATGYTPVDMLSLFGSHINIGCFPSTIAFVNSSFAIANIDGDLSAMFPYLGAEAGEYPIFLETFAGSDNLTSVPDTLFGGYTTGAPYMFAATFADSGLTSLPGGLFDNITTGAEGMFFGTFEYCENLTSIPENLFANITDGGDGMFVGTFAMCPNLTGFVPPTLFAGLIENGSPMPEMMAQSSLLNGMVGDEDFSMSIFAETSLRTRCPARYYQYITGYEDYWDGKVSCKPCPDGTTSPVGSTNISQCVEQSDPNENDYKFSIITTDLDDGDRFEFYLSAAGTFYVDCGEGGVLYSADDEIYDDDDPGDISGGDIHGGDDCKQCTPTNGAMMASRRMRATPTFTRSASRLFGSRVPSIKLSSRSTDTDVTSGTEIYREDNTNLTEYACVYSTGGEKTIRFGGRATGYTDADLVSAGEMATTIIFDSRKISDIDGNLSEIFPNFGPDNSEHPMFFGTFANMWGNGESSSLTSIPETLFSGYTTGAPYMFAMTFNGSSLTSIPENLFANITTGAEGMFLGTFVGCENLTSIPENLFANITDGGDGMFVGTFAMCPNLTGFVPPTLFAGLIENGSPMPEMMAQSSLLSNQTMSIFIETSMDTECPENYYQYITGYEDYWDDRVSCKPCPNGGTSPAGSTDVSQCDIPHEYPFSITTTNMSAGDTFTFLLGASGEFYIDCGDGGTLSGTGVNGDTITKSDSTPYTYTCTYETGGEKTVRFGGIATGYRSGWNTVLKFTTPTKVGSVSGDLSAVFPDLGEDVTRYPQFNQTFENCTNLTSISGTLFQGYTVAKPGMFHSTFWKCSGLTEIPHDLFANITSGKFFHVFGDCTGLTEIPHDLFKNVTSGTFQHMFSGCSGLTEIPHDLFSSLTDSDTAMFFYTFAGCTGLTEIPHDLFDFGGNMVSGKSNMFNETFIGCTGLTEIPHDLFSHITSVSYATFEATFENCTSITSIPPDLFENITAGASEAFAGTFLGCTGLTSLPENLFANITSLDDNSEWAFGWTFSDCTGLTGYIPPSLFAGLIANGSPYQYGSDMMDGIFANTGALATSCDAFPGMQQYITNYEDYWDGHVSCEPAEPAEFVCESGKYLHIGEDKMCLTKTKPHTRPLLVTKIGNKQYYLRMSPSEVPINNTSNKKFNVLHNGMVYRVFDESMWDEMKGP